MIIGFSSSVRYPLPGETEIGSAGEQPVEG